MVLDHLANDVVAIRAGERAGPYGPVVMLLRPRQDSGGVCVQQFIRVFLEPVFQIRTPEDISHAMAAKGASVRLANIEEQYRRASSDDDCRNNITAPWTFAPDVGTFLQVQTVLDDLRATLAAGRTVASYTCTIAVMHASDRPCSDGKADLKAFLSLNMRNIFWVDKSTAQVSSDRGQQVRLQIHFKGASVDTLNLDNDPYIFE
jgi:hypothetical protein